MKRRLSDSNEFIPSKRRKIDPEFEAQLLEELTNDIKIDEECTADEDLLLNSDDEEQLKQLVDRMPDLNQRFGYIKQTPLMVLIENGMTDLAEYLIKEKNIDLTITDENLQSALHYACENAEEEIAWLVIERMKHDLEYLNQLDGDAMSPLIYAVQSGCTATVGKLLQLKVEWRYKYDEDKEQMCALLEANSVNLFDEFKLRLFSTYLVQIEKKREQLAIVNKAIENSNLEVLDNILPRYTLENYFGGEEYSGDEENSREEDSDTCQERDENMSSLALAIRAGDEKIIRYLSTRKAWFKNLASVAVDTDDMDIVKLMQELAAVENENYAMLEYLFTETELKKDLQSEEAKFSFNVAVLVPESTSFARLMIKHGAEMPRRLQHWDMGSFGEDFHDRYLRSHLFGPKFEWWSPEEANYIRDVSYRFVPYEGDDVSHLLACSGDSKRAIFGYFNCLEDIHSVMVTCKQFCEIIDAQDYWKAQWFATYELAVIDGSEDVDWKKMFLEMDKLFKVKTGKKYGLWTFEENCRVARLCVLEGSYKYEVRAQDGITSIRTVVPEPRNPTSHFITCGLDEEINFDVYDGCWIESPLPMDKVKLFLPSGQIGFVTYDRLPEEDPEDQ